MGDEENHLNSPLCEHVRKGLILCDVDPSMMRREQSMNRHGDKRNPGVKEPQHYLNGSSVSLSCPKDNQPAVRTEEPALPPVRPTPDSR